MFTKKLTSVLRCAFSFVLVSQCILNVQSQPGDASSASLSKTPIGIYSRRNAFGDVQNAASLNNAPVGLYGKTHYPTVPVPYRFPFYGSPFSPFFFPPFFGLPNFGKPTRPQLPVRPQPPVRPHPPGRPQLPVRPQPPVRPPSRPPVRPAPVGTRPPPGRPLAPPSRPRPVAPTKGPPGKPGITPRLLGGLGGGLFGGGLPIIGDIFG